MECIEAELSLFTLNAVIEVGLLFKELKGWSQAALQISGKECLREREEPVQMPYGGTKNKREPVQCVWVKVSKRWDHRRRGKGEGKWQGKWSD